MITALPYQTSGGKVLGGGSGVDGTTGNLGTVSGAATMDVQFFTRLAITVGEASTLKLRGGGNPINNGGTIDFLDTASVLQFDSETYAAFTNEHISKITYQGAGLAFGADPFAVETGDACRDTTSLLDAIQ